MTAVLTFLAPPPGFSPHTEFILQPVDGAEGLFAMQATAQSGLRVYLVDPRTVLDDYTPTLADEHAAALALTSPSDVLLLVVAHPTEGHVSVNLLAPVVINTATGAAAQVILEDQDYPVRALLV